MNLTPGEFVILNCVIVIFVVASFFFIRRTPRPPVQLNLKDSDEFAPMRDVSEVSDVKNHRSRISDSSYPAAANGGRPVHNPSRIEYRPRKPVHVSDIDQDPATRDVCVLFNWNGHTWNAYEVLGLPAGSSVDAVKGAYEHLRKSVQPESVPFISAAFEAVMKRR